MDKLLRALANESDRSAQFKTVMTYCDGEIEQQFTGLVKGVIATEKLGAEGFGYDPIFVPEDQQLTFAQMPLAQKNLYSHRARAMAQFLAFLKTKAL
jgi:XTP/dITP diphosphohydrolase